MANRSRHVRASTHRPATVLPLCAYVAAIVQPRCCSAKSSASGEALFPACAVALAVLPPPRREVLRCFARAARVRSGVRMQWQRMPAGLNRTRLPAVQGAGRRRGLPRRESPMAAARPRPFVARASCRRRARATPAPSVSSRYSGEQRGKVLPAQRVKGSEAESQ